MNLSKKKVLVTGADGFIGSHLAELLTRKGAKVRAMVQYNSFNSFGWLEGSKLAADMEIIASDIRDPFAVKKAVKGTDVVFNLAALIAIPYSYIAPQSYTETNVAGAVNVCQAALECGTGLVLQTSTSEVYGTAKYVPIDEKHPLQPQSPYSASKIGADAAAMSYHNSFGLPVIIARPFNTYGPRQSARAVIPTVITQILAGQRVLSLGNTAPKRDFNYVSDVCRGFELLAGCKKAVGMAVNIGSNTEISVRETALKIAGIMGAAVSFKTDSGRVRPKKSEVERLRCDNSLIKKLAGYKPGVSIDEGLRETVKWFSGGSNLKKYKADRYNV